MSSGTAVTYQNERGEVTDAGEVYLDPNANAGTTVEGSPAATVNDRRASEATQRPTQPLTRIRGDFAPPPAAKPCPTTCREALPHHLPRSRGRLLIREPGIDTRTVG